MSITTSFRKRLAPVCCLAWRKVHTQLCQLHSGVLGLQSWEYSCIDLRFLSDVVMQRESGNLLYARQSPRASSWCEMGSKTLPCQKHVISKAPVKGVLVGRAEAAELRLASRHLV